MSEMPSRESFVNKKNKRVRPSQYASLLAMGVGQSLGTALQIPEAEAQEPAPRGFERNDAIGSLVSKLNSLQARQEQVVEGKEFACIVENIYHEARSENDEEKLRVALVTLSRVIDEGQKYPNTPCGVVYDPKQFSWTLSDMIKNAKKDERQMKKIASLLQNIVHGKTASIATTLLSLALKMGERPLFYKRTDGRGVSERSKAFFATLIPIELGPNQAPAAHTFYRLPTRAEIAARRK